MNEERTIMDAPQDFYVRAGLAPPRDPVNQHRYPGAPGHDKENPMDCFTSDCSNGCGCWTGPFRSGGPKGVDPFGECPGPKS